jgi:hypothetical protein
MWKVVIGCILLTLGMLTALQSLTAGFQGQSLLAIAIVIVFCSLSIWGGWRLSRPKPKALGWILFICGLLGLVGVLAIWFPWGDSILAKISIISSKIAAFIGSLWASVYGWALSHPKTNRP